MFTNYLKIAFRTLWRRKGFSFLNIAGLAVGMASAILILLWIYNESSYDDFHVNKDRIFMAWHRGMVNGKLECWNFTPKVMGPVMEKDFPSVAATSRIEDRWFVAGVGDKKMSSHAFVVDPAWLKIFSFPLAQGNPATALHDTYDIVITESMARKFFGRTDVMNATIEVDHHPFTVTGILKDLPSNTNFDFEFLIPWAYQKVIGMDSGDWATDGAQTVVMLQPNVTRAEADNQIKDFTIRHTTGAQHDAGAQHDELFLHPLDQWHLFDRFENGVNTGGLIGTVRLFGLIASFILLVACINFMNLSTARSERRAREVGIRKVAGAYRSMLIGQFLGESILMAAISGLLALLLAQIALPAFDALVRKPLVLPYANPAAVGLYLLFILSTGVLAGSYPAFFLSSFRPVSVLKGTFRHSNAAVNPRKALVVLQFGFAILLIISTLIVVRQIRYAQDRATGYDHDRLLYHWTTGDLNRNFTSLRSELLASGIVSDISRSNSSMTIIMDDSRDIKWTGKTPGDKTDFIRMSEDQDLVRTTGMQLVEGRDMDLQQYPTDSTAAIINQSAARAMGFRQPVGQLIRDGAMTFHVVGVIRDFVVGSPYDLTRPMLIEGTKGDAFNVINIRLADGQGTSQRIAGLRKVFQQYNPAFPFEYHFTRDDYARKFADTEATATLSGLFAGLTIFISCLGLFGLAAYMAESRIKEIGVRKVLGASVISITALLTREFVTLVLIAFLIASPIAGYAMHRWLQGFEYRIGMGVGIFLLAGSLAVAIAVLTVGYQAVMAARANPAKSLRPE